jgi:hypothetical protein
MSFANYSTQNLERCAQGCSKWYHLKSQDGCGVCKGKRRHEDSVERAEANKKREDAKKSSDDDFFNRGKKIRAS